MFDSDQESEYDAITDPNMYKEQIIFQDLIKQNTNNE